MGSTNFNPILIFASCVVGNYLFFLCSLYSDALGLNKWLASISPDGGNVKQLSASTLRSSSRPGPDHSIYPLFRSKSRRLVLRPTSKNTWRASTTSGRNA